MIIFEEDLSSGYRQRTIKNASADVTIAIATDFKSGGEILTKNSVLKQNKVYIAIDAHNKEITQERIDKLVGKINSVNIDNLLIDKNDLYSEERLKNSLGTKDTFLSNFEQLENPIVDEFGNEYWNSEGYYMAQRTSISEIKVRIADMSVSGGQASRNARKIFALDMNESNRVKYMFKAVREKFKTNSHLILKLKSTGRHEIIEKNFWGDDLFGVVEETKRGANILGKILMIVRDEILQNKPKITLNIAGNGIYTMKGLLTQEVCDNFTYKLLKAVVEHPDLKYEISLIRSGGQTGFDEAGNKAAIKLGIPTLVYAPKGWKFKTLVGEFSNEKLFKMRFVN